MNLTSGTSTSPFEEGNAFAEAHFYDGGLRNKVVAQSTERPNWAPQYDWVGFRDEVRLQNGDYAVEIVKFAKGDASVSWIAIYTHAPDAKYGDRNNHAGVGVWLRDHFPHKPGLLLDGIRTLLDKLKNGSDEEFATASKKLLKGYLSRWVSPYAQLAFPLNGLPTAQGQGYGTHSYFVLQNDQTESRITDLINRAFFLHPDDQDSSRMLIHVSASTTSAGFDNHDRSDFDVELMRHLPGALTEQFQKISRLTAQSEKLTQEQDVLHSEIDKLQAERASLISDLESSKRSYEDFKQSIEQNDELKRYATIHNGLARVQETANEIIRSMPMLQRVITDEIRSEARKALANRPSQTQPSYPIDNPQPSHSRPQPSRGYEIDWVRSLLIVLVGLVSLGIIIFGFYSLFNYLT